MSGIQEKLLLCTVAQALGGEVKVKCGCTKTLARGFFTVTDVFEEGDLETVTTNFFCGDCKIHVTGPLLFMTFDEAEGYVDYLCGDNEHAESSLEIDLNKIAKGLVQVH